MYVFPGPARPRLNLNAPRGRRANNKGDEGGRDAISQDQIIPSCRAFNVAPDPPIPDLPRVRRFYGQPRRERKPLSGGKMLGEDANRAGTIALEQVRS